MNLKALLQSFPIVRQIVDMADDYPLISGGLVMLIAALLPYTGLDNASDLQQWLAAFGLFVYGGGSVWDYQDKKQHPER